MQYRVLLLLPVLLLSACNSYNLRYKADPQPEWANIFADYATLQDAIGVSVDTDGRRLEEIYILKTDGTRVNPLNISYPVFSQSTINTGVGVGTWPVGVGVGTGIPVGPDVARGLTTASFTSKDLGEAPWPLHVKLEGVNEVTIQLGGAPNAK